MRKELKSVTLQFLTS